MNGAESVADVNLARGGAQFAGDKEDLWRAIFDRAYPDEMKTDAQRVAILVRDGCVYSSLWDGVADRAASKPVPGLPPSFALLHVYLTITLPFPGINSHVKLPVGRVRHLRPPRRLKVPAMRSRASPLVSRACCFHRAWLMFYRIRDTLATLLFLPILCNEPRNRASPRQKGTQSPWSSLLTYVHSLRARSPPSLTRSAGNDALQVQNRHKREWGA